MADRKYIAGSTKFAYNGSLYERMQQKSHQYHRGEGVNILYVGGHARWVQADLNKGPTVAYLDKKDIPNCGDKGTNPMYNLHSSY
jgi:prepilin-type processing-associated H-X9-DG protein